MKKIYMYSLFLVFCLAAPILASDLEVLPQPVSGNINLCKDGSLAVENSEYLEWKQSFLADASLFQRYFYDGDLIASLKAIINTAKVPNQDVLFAYNTYRELRGRTPACTLDEIDLDWANSENGARFRLFCKCNLTLKALLLPSLLMALYLMKR